MARPDAALAAALSPAAAPSTEHRYQLNLMPSRRTRLVLLFAPAGGGGGQHRRPGAGGMNRPALAPSDWSSGSVLTEKAFYLRLPNWMTKPPVMMRESPNHVEAGIDSLKM